MSDYSSSQVLFTDGSKTALGSNMSRNGTQRIILVYNKKFVAPSFVAPSLKLSCLNRTFMMVPKQGSLRGWSQHPAGGCSWDNESQHLLLRLLSFVFLFLLSPL